MVYIIIMLCQIATILGKTFSFLLDFDDVLILFLQERRKTFLLQI